MAGRCLSPCFALYVLLSLLTHLAELALSALLAYTLYHHNSHRDVIFALTAGVIIIPLVTIQLLSAIFLLRRRGDVMTGWEAAWMAVIHLLQLGFVWRHVAVLREGDPLAKKKDLSELSVLRLTLTFAGGFPLVLIQLFLVLTEAEVRLPWVLYASLVASVLSVTWAVASFRRSRETLGGPESVGVLEWPGSLFRLLWRVGEITARVISLTLFASLYKEWVFLVLGFHWLVMLFCISLPQASSSEWASAPRARRVVFCLVTSYAYVFCYVNLCSVRAAVWYTLYYVIMFLENGTLSIVWLTKSENDSFTSRYLLVFISTLAFFAAMVCLAVYYKYFHVAIATFPDNAAGKSGAGGGGGVFVGNNGGCSSGGVGGVGIGCLNCRPSLSCNGKAGHHHHQELLRQQQLRGGGMNPAGWLSQYHSALTSGQYYKHAMHDSLLDSASDLASVATASSANRRLLVKSSRGGVCEMDKDGVVLGLGGPGDPDLDDGDGSRSCCCSSSSARRQGCCGGCGCACPDDGAGSVGSGQQTPRSITTNGTTGCCSNSHHHHQHHNHHHHHHHHRRCLKAAASRSDMTDTTSVLTLASGASQNLGYEGSDESQSNTVPAWLPSGGEGLIAKHLLTPDTGQGGAVPGDRQSRHRQQTAMEQYRCVLRQEAQRWGVSDGYVSGGDQQTGGPGAEWSKVAVTPLSPNAWALSEPDSETYACYCCHLSPGDSEVSSIFRAARSAHGEGPPHSCGCGGSGGGGGGGGGGGDVVYGIPSHPRRHGQASKTPQLQQHPLSSHFHHGNHRHHHHHHHQQQQPEGQGGDNGLSLDSPTSSSSQSRNQDACPCCVQGAEGAVEKYHSQPDVYTLSHHHHSHLGAGGGEGGGGVGAKQSVSDSEGLSRKRGGSPRKSKHSEKRRHREHGAGKPPRPGGPPQPLPQPQPQRGSSKEAPTASTPRSDSVSTVSATTANDSPRSAEEKSVKSVHKHVPSKLQVKAIAEKSDDDNKPVKSPSSTSTSPSSDNSSEPIYENVSASVQKTKTPSQKVGPPASTTTTTTTSKSVDKKRPGRAPAVTTGEPRKEDCKVTMVNDADEKFQQQQHNRENTQQSKAGKTEQSTKQKWRSSEEEEKLDSVNADSTGKGVNRDKAGRKASRSPRDPGDKRGNSGGKPDPWYVCSESEDSALPPETFSSSVDDGATDLDSDASFELII